MQDCVTARDCDMVVTYQKYCAGECHQKSDVQQFQFELGGKVTTCARTVMEVVSFR